MPLVGLKNVHVVKITAESSTATTYDAVIRPLAMAVSADIKPSVSTDTFYSDDQLTETVNALGDIAVDLEVGHLATADLAYLLGGTVNSDGVLELSASDQAPYVALGFESLKSNGGKRYMWLYRGKFTLPENALQTKADKTTFTSEKISGTFSPRLNDGKWKAQVDSDDTGLGTSVISGWYTTVYTTPAS